MKGLLQISKALILLVVGLISWGLYFEFVLNRRTNLYVGGAFTILLIIVTVGIVYLLIKNLRKFLKL